MPYTLTIVRGEQRNATGEELALGDPLLTPATLDRLHDAGLDDDDTDMWVLVNAPGEDPGELRNVIGAIDVECHADAAWDGDSISVYIDDEAVASGPLESVDPDDDSPAATDRRRQVITAALAALGWEPIPGAEWLHVEGGLGSEAGAERVPVQRIVADEPRKATIYHARVGEYAKEIPSWSDLRANGVRVEDLGDGRVRFGDDAMAIFRTFTEDENGCITDAGIEDGVPYPMQIWIGGDPYPVWVDPESVTAYIAVPDRTDMRSDWEPLEAGTDVWLAAAGAAGLAVKVTSTDADVLPNDGHAAAFVEVGGVEYVLDVRDAGPGELAVRAIER
jgi:hypothetical protein